MRGRTPEWLLQVAGGLNDGRKWTSRKLRSLPRPVRYGSWIVVQAVLFKLQPWLWNGLVSVVGIVTGLLKLQLHVQLLVVVLAILTTQTILTENRFKRTWKIVESMDRSAEDTPILADGGSNVDSEFESFKRSSWRVHVVCGAIAGGAFGIGWGPAGVIGLAILGGMLGDEWAKHTFED